MDSNDKHSKNERTDDVLRDFISKLPSSSDEKPNKTEKDTTFDNATKGETQKSKLPTLIHRCYITDGTPHIIQTDLGYHVLAQLNEDHSIFIYKPNGEIVKTSPWYRNSTLDINKVLSEHWTYGSRHMSWKSHLKLLTPKEKESLRQEIGKLILELPEQNSPHDQTEVEELEYYFTNFSLPTRQVLECYFHPSNIWTQHYPDVYKCYGYELEVYISGKYTRNNTASICTPIEVFTDKQLSKSKLAYTVELDRKPSLQEVVRLITIFEKAKNDPKLRCRLDIENKNSDFWLEKPLIKRIVDCLQYPNTQITTEQQQIIDLSELIQSQAQHTSIKYNQMYNGLGLLDNIVDQNGQKIELTPHFLKQLRWSELNDTKARNRGYYFISHFDKYTIYKNIFRFDLYTIRSDESNFEYHVYHNGTTPVCCSTNFDPIESNNKPLLDPVTQKSKVYDITPKSLYLDTLDEWTDLDMDATRKDQFHPSGLLQDWVPAILQCCSKCPIPSCVSKHTVFDRWSKKFRRLRRVEIRNDILDKCIWQPVEIDHYDHKNFDGEWKYTKIDKIPIFKCFNPKPKHECSEDEEHQHYTHLITYSTTRGLSGLDPDHFELGDEDKLRQDREDQNIWTPPAQPCEPGCHIPTEILELKLTYTDNILLWYKNFSLKTHILNHKQWQSVNFPCTVTYKHFWEMIIFEDRPAFRCRNSFTSISMNYSLTSDKRWTLAYCFTEDQFRQATWKQNKNDSSYSCRIHKARITIPTLISQDYTVTLDSGQTCTYTFGFNRIGTPNIYTKLPESPERRMDYDMMSEHPLNIDNFGITESYLRQQQHFSKHDEATDYDLSMKIIQQLRISQHMDENTHKIISMIPTTAIPSPRQVAVDKNESDPDLKVGADEKIISNKTKKRKEKRK